MKVIISGKICAAPDFRSTFVDQNFLEGFFKETILQSTFSISQIVIGLGLYDGRINDLAKRFAFANDLPIKTFNPSSDIFSNPQCDIQLCNDMIAYSDALIFFRLNCPSLGASYLPDVAVYSGLAVFVVSIEKYMGTKFYSRSKEHESNNCRFENDN